MTSRFFRSRMVAYIPVIVSVALLSTFALTAVSAASNKYFVNKNVDYGGGVLIANKPGGYYAGRLFPNQSFIRDNSVIHHGDNNSSYYKGYAVGNIGDCFWLGPSRGVSGVNSYLTANGTSSTTCNGSTTAGHSWLGPPFNDGTTLGKDFNCPVSGGVDNWGGYVELTGNTGFYYNLDWSWSGSYYSGGALRDFGGDLYAGQGVYYRYTTHSGQWAVVFHPSLGWGFISAAAVPHVKHFSDAGSTNRRFCMTGALMPSPQPFRGLGGSFASKPTIVSRGNFQLSSMFARATSGSIMTSSYDAATGRWGGWSDLGGQFVGNPVAVSRNPDSIDVFARATDDTLKLNSWRAGSGAWSGWSTVATGAASNPTAISRNGVDTSVYYRGFDNHLWQKAWTNDTLVATVDLGGDIRGNPQAIARTSGNEDIFVRGAGGQLMHKSWSSTTGWLSWVDRGGVITSDPTLLSRSSAFINIYARGTTGRLYQMAYADPGQWYGWFDLGGDVNSTHNLTALATTSDNEDIYGLAADGSLRQKSWSGGAGWLNWRNFGGVQLSDLASHNYYPHSYSVFGVGTDNQIYELRWSS